MISEKSENVNGWKKKFSYFCFYFSVDLNTHPFNAL